MACEHKHDPAYTCKLCGQCCACKHKYKEVDGVWMVRCKNSPWRRCVGPVELPQGF